jgi:hypothetical protein
LAASPTTAIGAEPTITLIAIRQSGWRRPSALATPRTKPVTNFTMSRQK